MCKLHWECLLYKLRIYDFKRINAEAGTNVWYNILYKPSVKYNTMFLFIIIGYSTFNAHKPC